MRFNLNLKRGNYAIQFTLNGKQHTLFPGTQDQRSAEQVRVRMEFDWSQGKFDSTLESYKLKNWGKVEVPKKQYKLLELYDLWTDSLELSKDTYNNHYLNLRQHIERANPKWHDTFWFVELRYRWSAYTFNSRRGFLKTCIQWAINQELIVGTNPYSSLKPKKREGVDRVRPFSTTEISRICEAFEEEKPYYYPFVVFQFLTGCRPGETTALQWKHVDFEAKRILIEQAYGRDTSEDKWATKKKLKSTKTGDSGYLPLEGLLFDLLREESIFRQPGPNDLVFPGMKGGNLDIRNFRKIWKRMLADLGIEYRYPYQCRHTALSQIATSQGILAAAKIARHRNASMVSKHYGRFVDDVKLPELPFSEK